MNSKRYIGDKPKVDKQYWWERLTKRQAYGVKHLLTEEQQDNIDYDPRFDEDQEQEEQEDES